MGYSFPTPSSAPIAPQTHIVKTIGRIVTIIIIVVTDEMWVCVCVCDDGSDGISWISEDGRWKTVKDWETVTANRGPCDARVRAHMRTRTRTHTSIRTQVRTKDPMPDGRPGKKKRKNEIIFFAPVDDKDTGEWYGPFASPANLAQ